MSAGDAAPAGAPAAERRGRRWGRIVSVAVLALAAAGSPWWGRAALSRLEFFRVRHVRIQGVRFLAPSELVLHLGVDTTASVWDPLDPLTARVRTHPLVEDATVRRSLPGTLVVRVTEKVPVALVPARGGFAAYDADARVLPIDPSRVPLDLPIVPARDTALLRLLGEVRQDHPALFARISEVRRVGRGELLVRLATVPVRAMADVHAGRLADIIPVEQDLARRRARVVELDLRYREQVIARLE